MSHCEVSVHQCMSCFSDSMSICLYVSCMYLCVFSCVVGVVCVGHRSTVVDSSVHRSIISTAPNELTARSNVTGKFCVHSTSAVYVAR